MAKRRNMPKIALFLNHPECSANCAVGMYEALYTHFNIEFFDKHGFNQKVFKEADLLAFPGGIGDSETFHTYIGDNKYYVQEAIANGKRYLGICMGAYWAGSHYFDIVEGFDCIQYIKRPRSGIKRSFATTVPIHWYAEQLDMFFYDGCTYSGSEKYFYTVARYKNKEPMAIIQNRIGLIGCHPESMKSWYVGDTMKLKWHEFYHHKLLLDFTKVLMEC